MKRFPLILIVLAIASCSSPTTTTSTEEAAAEEAPVGPSLVNVCLWNELGVREGAGDKAKYLTSIYLGEHLTMAGDSATEGTGNSAHLYYKVMMSDGKAGWVRSDFIARDILPAAIMTQANLCKRPDAATVTDVVFNVMEYVAARPAINGWVKIKGKRTGDKWFSEGYLKEESLTYDQLEVEFATLAKRANESDKESVRNALMSQMQSGTFAGTFFYGLTFETAEEEYAEGDDYEGEEEPQATLETMEDADGRIINIYGVAEYWYVYGGMRYKLEETSSENILNSGHTYFHVTQDQLDSLPEAERVLDFIPDYMQSLD